MVYQIIQLLIPIFHFQMKHNQNFAEWKRLPVIRKNKSERIEKHGEHVT